MDDRSDIVWNVLTKDLYGKLFAGRGYISQNLSDFLFADGVNLVTRPRSNMKNKLLPFGDKIMLHKMHKKVYH